ncbi:MAG: hypothetical protein ACFCD0_03030 [Gemmataceae bacterium]
MRFVWMALAVLLFFTLVKSSFGQEKTVLPGDEKKAEKKGDEKKGDEKKGDETDQKTEPKTDEKSKQQSKRASKIRPDQTLVGELTDMAAGEVEITVRYQVKVTRPDAVRRLAQWNQRKVQLTLNIQRARSAFQRQQNAYNLQVHLRTLPDLYEMKKGEQRYRVKLADDVKVRVKTPGPQYDVKGKPIRVTRKMLKKLQGDEGLPYFPGELGDIQTGRQVQVWIKQPRRPRNKRTKKTTKSKPVKNKTNPTNSKKNPLAAILGKVSKKTEPSTETKKQNGEPAVDSSPKVVVIIVGEPVRR